MAIQQMFLWKHGFISVTNTYEGAAVSAEVVPTGATTLVVEAYGAGGGGGDTLDQSAGGGGGGYCRSSIALSSADWGANITYVIGAGGLTESNRSIPGDGTGGTTTVNLHDNIVSTPADLVAHGGTGASGNLTGNGGTATGGTSDNQTGNPGTPGGITGGLGGPPDAPDLDHSGYGGDGYNFGIAALIGFDGAIVFHYT